jgi:hypothetical protein
MEGAAGSATAEEGNTVTEPREWFTPARRAGMMRQMAGDINTYSREREREFGREHGYFLYSPANSEHEDGEIIDER